MSSDLISFVQSSLRAAADPAKAGPMAAYLKTEMPFYGVQTPARVPIAREVFKRYPPSTNLEYREQVERLWALPHREEKYLAIGVATRHKRYITMANLDLYRRLIVEGAWWDLVDSVAADLIGRLWSTDRAGMRPVLESFIDDESLWLRRTALICQIGLKGETDHAMLFDFCARRAAEKEFFIRKAIGWALREYAKTDPQAVRDFIALNRDRLSGLSYREASKHL